MKNTLRLRIEQGVAGLQKIRQDWRAVFNCLEKPTLCHDIRWITTLAEMLFGENLLTCVVYDGETVAAIFYFRRFSRRRGVLQYTAVESLANTEFIVLTDALIHPLYRKASILRFVLKELRDTYPTRWDVFTFRNCTARSQISQMTGIGRHLEQTHHSCAYVKCRSAADLLSVSQKQVKNILRCQRRVREELGEIHFSSSDRQSLKSHFDQFLDLENSGWKGGDGEATSILSRGRRSLAFYDRLLTNYSDSDDIKIFGLRFGSTVAASAISIRVQSVVHLLKIAYNEQVHRYSPGGMLFYEIIQQMSVMEGVDEINLLTCPKWSKRWHVCESPGRQIRVYSGTPRATAFRIFRFLRNQSYRRPSPSPRKGKHHTG